MSSLPQPISTPQAATSIAWSAWVPIAHAAKLLGLAEGTLRARCPQLEIAGHASKLCPPGAPANRTQWFISRAMDPRLSPDTEADGQCDLSMLTGKQRDQALQRWACLQQFRELRQREARPIRDWMPALLRRLGRDFPAARVSRSALYRWDQAVSRPADIVELADFRGGDQRSARFDEFWARFGRAYLHVNAPKVKHVYDEVRVTCRADGHEVPALGTVHKQLNLRIPPAVQARHRNRKEYNDRYLPTIEQDPERFAAGRCWVFDHTTMDLFVRTHNGKRVFRPTLTAAMDWRTRKIVAWCLSLVPSSDTILLTVKDGILDPSNMGGPSVVVFDNGRDFDAWFFDSRTKQMRRKKLNNPWLAESSFSGIFAHLQIEPHFTRTYTPNAKREIERWFGTMHDQFDRTFPTYCGKDPQSKPAGLEDRLANLPGVPTYAELHERLSLYVEAYNRRDQHSIQHLTENGLPVSPAHAMSQWCDSVRVFDRSALDLILLHHDRPVTVGKVGIGVTIAGQRHHYGMEHGVLVPELRAYQGTKRKVRAAYDPIDLSAVSVFDDSNSRLICIAPSNRGLAAGTGRQAVSESLKQQREYHKQLDAMGMGGGLMTRRMSSLEYQLTHNDLPETPEPLTRSMTPVRTGFEQQSNRMRHAAGGETFQDFAGRLNDATSGDSTTPSKRRGIPNLSRMFDGDTSDTSDEAPPRKIAPLALPADPAEPMRAARPAASAAAHTPRLPESDEPVRPAPPVSLTLPDDEGAAIPRPLHHDPYGPIAVIGHTHPIEHDQDPPQAPATEPAGQGDRLGALDLLARL